MSISIAVVAHTQRADQAHQLMETVGAQYLAMDNGTYGCNANHVRCWTYLAKQPTEWALVLEDDAQPIDDFHQQLDQALTNAPTDVVSLYLGTERPVWVEFEGRGSAQRLQPLILKALIRADQEHAAFITAPNLFHAVGIAIRTPLIPDMISHATKSPKPIDFAIGDWCTTHSHTIAYTTPSICDHADNPSVIRHHPDREPRLQPRKAHRVGGRNHWTNRAVTLL